MVQSVGHGLKIHGDLVTWQAEVKPLGLILGLLAVVVGQVHKGCTAPLGLDAGDAT